ncbi:MAG: hypothetical protein KC493_15045 [Bacteriovoracaceae bacterium]|nr:hypothetical protein [Bacteriovoracaceae bacterium]
MNYLIFIFSLLLLFSSCGKDKLNKNNITVDFKSGSLSAGPSPSSTQGRLFSVSDLKFCITKIKLMKSHDDDSFAEGEDDDIYEARIGLVNLEDGSSTVTWGNASLPEGLIVKGVKVKVHKDKDSCQGFDYSVSYNGHSLNQDLEMKFMFPEKITISEGTTITFNMSQIVQVFESAISAEEFTEGGISRYINSMLSSAHKD